MSVEPRGQLGFEFEPTEDDVRLADAEKAIKVKLEVKRDDLQRRVSGFDLDTIEHRVAWVLNNVPATRDSDKELFAEYCRAFAREVAGSGVIRLEQIKDLPNFWSIDRARRKIQNTYRMYEASVEVQRERGVISDEEAVRRAGEERPAPALNVFADESGKTQDRLVVGSVWFVVPRDVPRLFRELDEWRGAKLGGSEVHFKKISAGNVDRYKTFVDRFVRHDPFMGFKALVWEKEGIGDIPTALSEMFARVLRAGVEHEHSTGRAPLPRRLNFTKDAESPGFDRRVLAGVRERLEDARSSVFNGGLTIGTLDAEDSKTSPFLQVADLFTASMSRIANVDGDGPKDEFARYFLSAAGGTLDDSHSDRTVVLA